MVIYPVLNVCFPCLKHLLYYALSTVAMMSDQNMDEDSTGRSVSPPAFTAWVLFFCFISKYIKTRGQN